MTILIAAAVFCVWAYFWVRGALWAALLMALPCAGYFLMGAVTNTLLGGGFNDIVAALRSQNGQILVVACLIAFIPRIIYAKLERDHSRRMNGLRLTGFRDAGGG